MFTGSLFTTSALTVLFRPPCRSPGPSGGQSKRPMDKKLRRQIANCNERRRMQSINAGFHTLRVLMPHLQGEKLSKVCNLHTGGRCVCVKGLIVLLPTSGCCTPACSRAHFPTESREGATPPTKHLPPCHAL